MENKNPIVTIEMENGDKMVAELYPHIAPNTVNNFISLVKDGYYDGIIYKVDALMETEWVDQDTL